MGRSFFELPILIAFIFQLIQSIPDVIWSGLIASVLTLGGVLVSNASNTKRMLRQLQHDSSEKARERHASLRREVCLKAIEELTKAMSYLASLPDRDPSKENLADGVQGFAAAAAQLQLVAEPKTALLANSVATSIGQIAIRSVGRALPLQLIRSRISTQNDLYGEAQADIKRILAEMEKFNEAGGSDKRLWDALQRSFQSSSERSSNHANERGKLWASLNKENLAYQKQLMAEMRDLIVKQVSLVVEIRRDLGLEGNLEEFRTQMEAQWVDIANEAHAVFEQLDRELLAQDDIVVPRGPLS